MTQGAQCRHCGGTHNPGIPLCPVTGRPLQPGPRPPDASSLSNVGRVIDGRYALLSVIGQGAMATVYEAESQSIGRKMAIKILHPHKSLDPVAVKRLQREARLAGSIGHPNICDVYDIGFLEGGTPYLVMERLIGETLEQRIAREGYLRLDEALDIFIQVLSALIATHAKGIVHRDVSPQNIFLAVREGCPPVAKLLDFGLCRPTEQVVDGLTAKGQLVGTPKYMAPEQLQGHEVDARADLYGCGAVLYETLSGHPPFTAPSRVELIMEVVYGHRRPARSYRPELPMQIDVVLAKAMARDRGTRFQDAAAFQKALETLRRAQGKPTALDVVPSTISPATLLSDPGPPRFEEPTLVDSIEVVFSASPDTGPETLRERMPSTLVEEFEADTRVEKRRP